MDVAKDKIMHNNANKSLSGQSRKTSSFSREKTDQMIRMMHKELREHDRTCSVKDDHLAQSAHST